MRMAKRREIQVTSHSRGTGYHRQRRVPDYTEKLGFVPPGVLAFRDVCRTHTDLRTVRAAVCPPLAAGNKAPMLIFPGTAVGEHSMRTLLLTSVLASLPFDYVARQKFSGGSLNKFILIQLPVVDLEQLRSPLWKGLTEAGSLRGQWSWHTRHTHSAVCQSVWVRLSTIRLG